MGFGTGRYGVSFFGTDVLNPTTPPVFLTPPTALLFDLRTKAFRQNADGSMASIHPVDQKVALALGLVKGRIKSVPAQGSDFSALSRLPPEQIQPAAEKICRLNPIIAKLVRAGDITILQVLTSTPFRGRNEVFFEYRNERTGQRQKA